MAKRKKEIKHNYERKESYLPHEVLDFLPNADDYPKEFKMKNVKKDYDGDMMKMGSQRYYVFAKSLKCEYCDLVGSIMHKERNLTKHGKSQNCGFHFNLYAINDKGEEVMMTKDHIVAKSRGGKDVIKNYVTSCKSCNEKKGSKSFDDFKTIKQNQMIEKAKQSMFEKQSIGRSLRDKKDVKILEIE